AVPGVEGQFVGGQQRRYEVAAGTSCGRTAEPAHDRGQLGGGRFGDIVGVSGFDSGHRLAGVWLFAVDDGSEPVGAAAAVVGVAPEDCDDAAQVAAQVVGASRGNGVWEPVHDGRG